MSSNLNFIQFTEPMAGAGGAFSDTLNRALRNALSLSGYNPDATTFSGLHGPVFNVKAFGAKGDGVTDDAVALRAAFTAAAAVSGTVVFPDGTYNYGSAITTLADSRNITLRGMNGGWAGATGSSMSRLVYTGTGAGVAFSVASSYGLRVEGLRFGYTSASFTGTLFGTGWSASNQDPQSLTLRECAFEGIGAATAATLINVDRLITSSITRCFFTSAVRAITCTATIYSNVITVKECQFFQTGSAPILNPGDSWNIIGNTFEGTTSGKAGALEMDSTSARNVNALSYQGNWHGDAFTAGGNWLTGLRMLGGAILGNFFSTPGSAAEYSIGLYGGEGILISGNHFEGTNAIKFLVAATQRCTIIGNDFGTVTNPIVSPANGNSTLVLGNYGIGIANVTGPWFGNLAGKQMAIQLAGAGVISDGTTFSGANAVAYGASMNIDVSTTNIATITATNNSAFSISTVNSSAGQKLRVRIRNASGGALGVATWNAVFMMGAAWVQPANGFSRTIDFDFDGTNWVEAARSAADVAN